MIIAHECNNCSVPDYINDVEGGNDGKGVSKRFGGEREPRI